MKTGPIDTEVPSEPSEYQVCVVGVKQGQTQAVINEICSLTGQDVNELKHLVENVSNVPVLLNITSSDEENIQRIVHSLRESGATVTYVNMTEFLTNYQAQQEVLKTRIQELFEINGVDNEYLFSTVIDKWDTEKYSRAVQTGVVVMGMIATWAMSFASFA